MELFYVKHKVKDYDAWRSFFEGDRGRIAKIGGKCIDVMRSIDDPNEIHLIFEVPDGAAFEALMKTPDLGDQLQKAGVSGQPVTYRLEEVPH